MKRNRAMAAIVVIAAAFGAVGWFVGSRSANDDSPSWLFSHTAASGTVAENADGSYTITLTGVDSRVIAFTDRPNRDAGTIEASEYYANWQSMFGTSAPNAVLVEHTAVNGADSLVVTMYSPQLTTNGLQFRATLLEDEDAIQRLQPLVGALHVGMPSQFAGVSLFIDAWPTSVNLKL